MGAAANIKDGHSERITSGLRVLGRVRLSRSAEESTSVQRQREIIESWANQNDHTIIGWAEDLDISGAVDPFDTPALGPWLTEHRKHEWDVLATWKLDRISRRVIPMNKVFGWVLDNDKTLVCVSENLDLSTWIGRLIANVIAGVAEGELEAIRERTRGSQRKLRELGRWGGGIVFYGFKPAKHSDAGWVWERDEYSAGILDEIIAELLDGKSMQSIAGVLNRRGVLSPSDYTRQRNGNPTLGKKWSTSGIRAVLSSKSLLGHMTHGRVTVRDDEGNPVLKGPSLIEPDLFDRLQAALDAKSFKVTNRSSGASPLLGVAVCKAPCHRQDCPGGSSCGCPVCGRLMHSRKHHKPGYGKTYRYYQCTGGKSAGHGERDHGTNTLNADDLEGLLEERFLLALRDQKVRQRVYIRAENHQIELEEATRAVDELTSLIGTMTSDTLRKRLTEQLGALDSRITELEKLPPSESRWEYRESPETYGQAWGLADTEGRRQLLLKSGITAAVYSWGRTNQTPGVLEVDLRIPEDITERMA